MPVPRGQPPLSADRSHYRHGQCIVTLANIFTIITQLNWDKVVPSLLLPLEIGQRLKPNIIDRRGFSMDPVTIGYAK